MATFLTIIASLVITGGFFVAMNLTIINRYENIMRNMVAEYQLIGKTQALTESFYNLIKYINDEERMEAFTSNRSELQDLLITLDGTMDNQESFSIYIGLRNTISALIADSEKGIEAILSRDYSQVTVYYNSVSNKNTFVKDNTTQLLLQQLENLKSIQLEMVKLQKLSEFAALSFFILMIGITVLYALRFSNKLVNPLEELTTLAKTIESGNLEVTVDKKLLARDDEISSLANSLSRMIFYLKNNIVKLQEYNEEIKKSRNRWRSEKDKLQQYLDIAGVFVIIFDFDNKIISINKKGREILAVGEADISKQDWVSNYVVKGDRLKTRSLINFIVSGISLVDTIENVIVGQSRLERNIVWHFSVLENEAGKPQSVLGTGVDVTELAQARMTINQLKDVDKLKNEVLNIATHELKTPLISIVGLSEVMKKNPKTIPVDYQEYVSIINSEGEKLSKLIKSMLTASRNELGQVVVTKTKIVLADLALSLKTPLEMLTKRTDSQLLIDNQVPNLSLESDQEKISQVIYNFVDNAVKYGPKKQTVKVVFSCPDKNNVKVVVSGEGAGIEKGLQKKLFLKFSQLEPSLSRSQDGMGLGLYICKQNIDALGGKIGVESEPGRGAIFYFSLPLNNKNI